MRKTENMTGPDDARSLIGDCTLGRKDVGRMTPFFRFNCMKKNIGLRKFDIDTRRGKKEARR